MNQFSNTQRSIITFAYDEMLRTFVSNKLSPISILLYVAAVYMNWVESIKENTSNLVFLESEGLNLPATLRILQVILITAHGNTYQ